jgi:TPR repeat protein
MDASSPITTSTLFSNFLEPTSKVAPPTVNAKPEPIISLPAPEDPDVVAVRQLRLAANRGDAEAQLQLGYMYEAGRGGLPSDPAQAMSLFKLSASQGYAEAQMQLGYRYERGEVVPKDMQAAASYYRLAADQGNAAGQSNLADAYEKGTGVSKNLCETMRLRKLAAAQGEKYAQKNLAEMRGVARCKS